MKLIHTLILGTVAAAVASSAASAAPVVFFGEDTNSGQIVTTRTNADAARAAFFANLVNVQTETFEGFTGGAAAPLTANFGNAGTALLSGVGSIVNGTSNNSVGRYAISGTKYFNTNGTFSLTFSNPVSAFGFYGTDIGDVGGSLTLTLTGSNGLTILPVDNVTGTVANGSALYYGFYDTANTYTSISFAGAGNDSFGFDDFSIGSRAQVNPAPAVPEPASWAMMILGMGAVGYAMRRKMRASDAKFDAHIKAVTYGTAA